VSHDEPPLVTDISTLELVIGEGEFTGADLTLANTAPSSSYGGARNSRLALPSSVQLDVQNR
jgi:hypothetical protein